MNAAASTLHEEHEHIKHLLGAMDGIAKAIEDGKTLPVEDVTSAVEVASGFADRCHHAKEEKVLFPALHRVKTAEADRLVHELEGDHKAARKVIASIKADAWAAGALDAAGRARLAHDLTLYGRLLRRHIDIEEQRLLPMADTLPAHLASEVAEAFEKIEREETGEGEHAHFELLIHALASRYPDPDGHHAHHPPTH